MEQLRPHLREISFIGNMAFPPDHPVEQARMFCKATNVIYDASGNALTIRFGGNDPQELSRQATCMQERLKGSDVNVEGFPAN